MTRWLFLLRAFFPSWRFFVHTGAELRLEMRPAATAPWHNCLPPIARTWRRCVLNPHGNFLHACHNHLQHLVTDLNELPTPALPVEELEAMTSYRLARNLVVFQLRGQQPAWSHYQFRLTAGYDEVLVSPLYECPP